MAYSSRRTRLLYIASEILVGARCVWVNCSKSVDEKRTKCGGYV